MFSRKRLKKSRLAVTRRQLESLEERKVLASITVSPVTPTVDNADIAMLNASGQFDPGGAQGHIWTNRPIQGQTFTTGSNPNGYVLSSFTLQNEENTINNNTATFTGRIGTVSGNQFTEVALETSNNSISYVPNDYITFNFDSPVFLAPDTTYGFELGTTGSGFTTWNNDNSNYAGGQGYSSGANHVPDDANLILHNLDRIFHLDIQAFEANPDSGTTSEVTVLTTVEQYVETFDTDAADAAAINGAYPNLDAGTIDADVTGGVLTIDNPTGANSTFEVEISVPDPGGANRIIRADIGAIPASPGGYNVGLSIGPNNIVFHPGFTGTPGAFRVEGTGGFGNTDMGFVPAVNALHSFVVEENAATGEFTITVVDANDSSHVFTTSFTNPAAVGGDIALRRSGPGPSPALFDNLSIEVDNLLANDASPATVVDFDSTSTLGAAVNVNPDGTFTYDPSGSPTLRALDNTDPPLADTFDYTIAPYTAPAHGRFVMVQNNGTATRRMDIGEIEVFAPGVTPSVDHAGGTGALNPGDDLAFSGNGASLFDKGATSGFSQPHGGDDDPRLIDAAETTGGGTWSSNGVGNFVIIDLGMSFDIETVRVHQRNDGCCQDRLMDFTVSVLEDNGGTPGAVVSSAVFPGQPTDNGFAELTLAETVPMSTTTVTIDVTGLSFGENDTYPADPANTEDVAINVNAANGVLDNDDPGFMVIGNTDSANGASVTVNPDGSFTYDPTAAGPLQALEEGEVFDDTFDYTISQGTMPANGRYLMVQNNGTANRLLHIGELEAFAPGVTPAVDNAGDNQPLNPSIDLAFSGMGASFHSKGAISNFGNNHGGNDDANLINAMETDGASVFGIQGVGAFVIIDLGQDRDIETVRVHQRNGCCQDRLQDFTVSLLADDNGAPGAVVASGVFPGQPPNERFGEIVFAPIATGNSDTRTVTIAVTGVNDDPVAVDDTNAITEGGQNPPLNQVTGNVLTNDTDVDDVVAAFTVTSTGTLTGMYGSLELNSDGSYTYTLDDSNPTVDGLSIAESITDTFDYDMIDDTSGANQGTSSGTLAITIHGVNDPPFATDNTADVAEDGAQADSGNVITDDDGSGVDDDPETPNDLTATNFEGVTDPNVDVTGNFGTLDWEMDGSYTYTFTANGNPVVQALSVGETLTDPFDYTIVDPVQPAVGRFLMVQNNGTTSRRMDIGEIEAFLPGVVPAVDHAGGGGTLNPNDDLAFSGNGASVFDKGATSGFSQPHGGNDDPNLIDAAETTGAATWSSDGVGNFVIIDLGASYAVETVRVHQRNDGCCQDRLMDITVSLLADNGGTPGVVVSSMAFPGQPANNNFAEVTLPQVPSGNSATGTLTATIHGTNDAPTANDDPDETTDEDTVGNLNLAGNDTDPDQNGVAPDDVLVVAEVNGDAGPVVTLPSGAQVTINGDGTVDYDPNDSFEFLGDRGTIVETITDTFTYTISDGNGGTSAASVTVTITGVNDPPMAVDDPNATVNEDSGQPTGPAIVPIDVLANDTDGDIDGMPPDDTLTIVDAGGAGVGATVTLPSGATLTNNGTDVSYDPNGQFETLPFGQSAFDTFTYTIDDGNGGPLSTAMVTVEIVGAADAPDNATAVGDSIVEGEDVSFTGTFTDPDVGDSHTFEWTVVDLDNVAHVVSMDQNPTIAWADLVAAGVDDGPNTYTVNFTVTDAGGLSDTASTTLDIANAPPTIDIAGVPATDSPASQAVLGIPVSFTLIADDPSSTDDNAGFIYTIDWGDGSDPDMDGNVGQVVPGDMMFEVTHEFENFGMVTVTVTATDQDSGVSSPPATHTINIVPVAVVNDDLQATGTPGSDVIIFSQSNLGTLVRYNNIFFGPYSFSGSIIANGRDGSDRIVMAQGTNIPAVFDGGDGNDYLAASTADDTLMGGAGNDVILAGDGTNYVDGGADNDRIEGRDGVDVLFGGTGNDRLNGGAGDDILDGGADNDFIFGGLGNDLLVGRSGVDTINGHYGNDIVLGGDDSDQIFGGNEQDLLIGGGGLDRIRGDRGDDDLIGGNSALDADIETALDLVLASLGTLDFATADPNAAQQANDWFATGNDRAGFDSAISDGVLDELYGNVGADDYHNVGDAIRDYVAGEGLF